MSESFGGLPGPDLVPNPEAELRAADAQRPAEYRNATDRAGAGVDIRLLVGLAILIALAAWFLTSGRI